MPASQNPAVPERDTSRPGPVANFVFAAIWLSLGLWTIATAGPAPLRWVQFIGYAVMTVAFTAFGLRRLRARRSEI